MSKSVPLRNPRESQKKPQKKTEKVEQKITLVATLLLILLKGYRYGISPLFPPCCRYVPTCSEYAVEAIARYGALRGGWLAFCRILRCHPFAAGGYDPVK
jgi:hypothetical protein